MAFPFDFPFYLGGEASTSEDLIALYRQQLLNLLPPGRALTRRAATSLSNWLVSFSPELSRIHERLLDAYHESYPGTATERLDEWETLCGLPDSCTYLGTSTDQRRLSVLDKFAVDEGQAAPDFESIAAKYGYAVTVGRREVFRTGVHGIGHMPLYSVPWYFGALFSYEPQDDITDAVLRCALTKHAHGHIRSTFYPWDASAVVNTTALPSLRHHFIHGEWVTHEYSGTTRIDSWTNRESGNDLTGLANDLYKPNVVRDVDGWPAALCTTGTAKAFHGLSIKPTADAATLLEHQNFSLWVVVRFIGDSESDVLRGDTGGLYLATTNGTTGFDLELDYDGAVVEAPVAEGYLAVIHIATNGTNAYLQVNGNTPVSDTVNGTEATVREMELGNGADFQVMEVIAADFEGVPGSASNVDAVTTYLNEKYFRTNPLTV